MNTEIVKEDLRKWFKDGGWNRYNTKGEKVGKCARDDKDGDGKADGPKPKCLPASKAASLGKKKVAAAVKRKRAEDPNPDRKGAAKNVKTESVEVNEVVGTTIAGTVGAASAKKKDRVRKAVGSGAGYAVGSTIGKGVGAGAAGGVPIVGGLLKGVGGAVGSVAGGVGGAVVGNKLAGETKKKKRTNEEIEVRVSDFMEACWKGYEKKGMKTMFGKRYPNCVKKTRKEETELAEAPAAAPPKKPLKDTGNPVQNAWNKFVPPRESSANPNVRSGLRQPGKLEKPALDKLNKTAENINKPIKATSKAVKTVGNAAKATGDFIKNNPGKAAAIGAGVVGAGLLAKKALGGNKKKEQNEAVSYKDFMKECWKTHKKVGMKMKGGRMVPNCVPKTASDYKKEEVEIQTEGAAWTKKSGKNESGGLNEKGRKSYERENPGSDLKRPSKKVGNKRRASFCARMKGMRKRQKPSNNTGEDRLSKSLRAWNC